MIGEYQWKWLFRWTRSDKVGILITGNRHHKKSSQTLTLLHVISKERTPSHHATVAGFKMQAWLCCSRSRSDSAKVLPLCSLFKWAWRKGRKARGRQSISSQRACHSAHSCRRGVSRGSVERKELIMMWHRLGLICCDESEGEMSRRMEKCIPPPPRHATPTFSFSLSFPGTMKYELALCCVPLNCIFCAHNGRRKRTKEMCHYLHLIWTIFSLLLYFFVEKNPFLFFRVEIWKVLKFKGTLIFSWLSESDMMCWQPYVHSSTQSPTTVQYTLDKESKLMLQ